MNSFDDELHVMTPSDDGSFTAYSKEYEEHYHSTRDGALHESLSKHIIPAFKIHEDKDEITILDICFGLGFNTLATLYYVKQNNIKSKVTIYSPELDSNLVKSLINFKYPEEFSGMKTVVDRLVEFGTYTDEQFHIEIFLGDARKYIKTFKESKFDVVYQDAFSPSSNPVLWTKEYFSDIQKIIKKEGVITTYSIALATRLALYENKFNVYVHSGKDFRASTLASCSKLENFTEVDMEHKIACNKDARPLSDRSL